MTDKERNGAHRKTTTNLPYNNSQKDANRLTSSTQKRHPRTVSRPTLPSKAASDIFGLRRRTTNKVEKTEHEQGGKNRAPASKLKFRKTKSKADTIKSRVDIIKNKATKTKSRSNGSKRHSYKKRSTKSPKLKHTQSASKYVQPPKLAHGDIRIIPLGGVEEVGKNMIVIENSEDIFIFDVGFQFTEEATPGIDYILPNTKYLEENKSKIKAVIITHGHLDHIGGIPYIMEKIGNPPLYTRQFTALMIKKRQEEFPHESILNIKVVEPGQRMKIGNTMIQFFPVTQSIPDSMGAVVETPNGNIVISGDLRLEHLNGVPSETEVANWRGLNKQKNLLFIGDSTNAENPGFSISDSTIFKTLEDIIKNTKSRLIIATFASQVERIIKLVEICEKYNRKVVAEGRSIKSNIEIAKLAGLLKPDDKTFIPIEDAKNYPPDKIVVLATGGQGEEFAALTRMGRKDHKHIALNERDTIVFSSSVIPGNEMSVQRLKDSLYRHGLKIIHYKVSDVHASGHANAGELKWINEQVNAKYFMPGYGFHSMLRAHADIAVSAGTKKENVIIPDNGMIIDIQKGEKIHIQPGKVPFNPIAVDGFSIGDIQDVVLRDRKMLAEDGIFVIIAMVDSRTRKVKKSPDIISRGFVYLRESQDLLRQARYIAKKTIEDNVGNKKQIDFDLIKDKVSENISKFLAQQTAKNPIVLPVILSI